MSCRGNGPFPTTRAAACFNISSYIKFTPQYARYDTESHASIQSLTSSAEKDSGPEAALSETSTYHIYLNEGGQHGDRCETITYVSYSRQDSFIRLGFNIDKRSIRSHRDRRLCTGAYADAHIKPTSTSPQFPLAHRNRCYRNL
jgi:hypothetical protein